MKTQRPELTESPVKSMSLSTSSQTTIQSEVLSGPMLSSTIGKRADPISEAVGDPNVLKENIEHLKSQIKEINNETIAIEHEMENRYKNMTMAQQKRKYLPKSITEEYEQKKQATSRPEIHPIDALSSFDRTRQAMNDRLGGGFDYDDFMFELKDIADEKNGILKDYKNTALEIPPPAPTGVAKYSFKTAPIKRKTKTTEKEEEKQQPQPVQSFGNKDEEMMDIDEEQIPVGSEYSGSLQKPSSGTRVQPASSRTKKKVTKVCMFLSQNIYYSSYQNQVGTYIFKATCRTRK